MNAVLTGLMEDATGFPIFLALAEAFIEYMEAGDSAEALKIIFRDLGGHQAVIQCRKRLMNQ